MKARLVFTRNASEQELEITGTTLTIGRGAECDFQIADDRVSTRHCRLWAHGGEWLVQDLRSTNRTFVNGEPVGDEMRRIDHGDVLRLGAHDATLLEARFLTDERSPPSPPPNERAAVGAAQLERNAELVRLGALCKTLQSQISERDVGAIAASRARETMAREIEELQQELSNLRADHGGCATDLERARTQRTELEARLAAQERKARTEIDDGSRRFKELESRLRRAESELEATKVALATASANYHTLKDAYEDALAKLALYSDRPSTESR